MHLSARNIALLMVFYGSFSLIFALIASITLPDCAYAYVDPSVVTYAIQAIAGVAVALSAVVGVAFRKTRKRLMNVLGINPDSKKETDPPFYQFESERPEAIYQTAGQLELGRQDADRASINSKTATVDQKRKKDAVESFRWPARFGLAFIVSFMAIGTLVVTAPVEIVYGSQSDFVFTPLDIAPMLLATTFVSSLGLSAVISLLRGKPFRIALALVFAIGFGFYVQAMFLDTGLPIADGESVNWKQYDFIAIVSAAVWLAALLCFTQAAKRWGKVASKAFACLAALLIVVQGVGVVSILSTTSSESTDEGLASRIVPTKEGLFDVSEKNNVIVFVLDTYDTAFFQQAIERQPDLVDKLTGFTWFENPTGSLIPTRYGVPFLLTGEFPHYDETWSSFLEKRYDRSHFLTDLHEAGYSVGLYSDQLRLDKTTEEIAVGKVFDTSFNLADSEGFAVMDNVNMVKAMLKCALYRDLPWVLKPRFWFVTRDISSAMLDKNALDPDAMTVYTLDDAAYYTELKQRGLTVNTRSNTGEYRLIHLDGVHKPYSLDENGTYVGKKKSDRISQAIGSLRIVEYYLDQMKELGVYDDATIILTADHGTFNHGLASEYIEYVEEESSPFIIAKLPQSHEEASKPMETSDAPVRHGDILPTIMKSAGLDYSSYDYKPLFDYTGKEDGNAPRLYITIFMDGSKDIQAAEYSIEGDVLDLANWHKTGNVWDCKK